MSKSYLFSGGFKPTNIATCAVWLDSADLSSITKDGSDLVATWVNKAKPVNALQSTDANKPIYTAAIIGGKPALKFYNASTASFMSIADNAVFDYTRFSAFVVARRHTDLGVTERIFGKFTATGNQREFIMQVVGADDTTQAIFSSNGTATASATSATVLSLNTNYIIDSYYDGTNGNIAVNNANAASGAVASIFNGTSDIFLGTRDSAAEPFAGYIGEAILYTSQLSAANRLRVLRYLSRKWSITIA